MNKKINHYITLAKRKNTTKWQAVIKHPDGNWRRVSTKTSDPTEAIEYAYNKLAEWRVLEANGLQTIGIRTFGYAAEKYLDVLEGSINAGNENTNKKKYPNVIRQWFVPFFGQTPIKNIDQDKITKFESHRKDVMGREPAKSTINFHNIVLRAIFNYALDKKWTTKDDIPKLTIKNKGKQTRRRGAFTPDEFNSLMEFLINWPAKTKNKMSMYKRELLHHYVIFLVRTGIRPGLESLRLRWSDFEFVKTPEKKSDYYRIQVRHGKKHADEEEAHRSIVVTQEAYDDIAEGLKFCRLVYGGMEPKKDDLVFSYLDGSPLDTSGPSEMFGKALDLCGLRKGNDGRSRSLYSCRHTYASWKLANGLPLQVLSVQMGADVKVLEDTYWHKKVDAHSEELLL